ncbi:Sec-independent protein translocase TatB [Microbacterium sp. B35-04]|uniref:Sec-independent protein translocase TatB n=1 Tax=unclassified Microbacterium TaxID=2609290 RepID=UPI0013D6574C|nr:MULTISPECIES: Sec-independent protein translocase TatB [unclassified Microbacterium]KAF2411644.1 Sec-independent protein translocase TatB [Microbacterium sp. B35-04]KAF2415499.1 Sec-independent protein translocase TatB [Microbacterium sp. B35-30]
MIFGLTIEKLLLIGLVAALILGPERLPRYAESLAGLTKRAREWVSTARTRVRDEMGEDFDDVDWRTLDPRQYDPRRIIREALLDDAPVASVAGSAKTTADTTAPTPPTAPVRSPFRGPADGPTPYDSEAT